jgi:hypothetical protein
MAATKATFVILTSQMAQNRGLVEPRACAIPHRRFQFHKRSQLLIRTHTETLSVAAVHVNNPDRSGGRRTASPTDF